MGWRLAPTLTTLFEQVNVAGPGRDKSWDGSIGDAAHSARASDHNPDSRGIVHAIDVTDDDTAPGFDATALRDSIVVSRDSRVKYLIHRGQIISGNGGPSPWVARPYTGPNSHYHHLHVSVTNAGESDTRPWALPLGSVRLIQEQLVKHGYPVAVDGRSGPITVAAIRKFQQDHGLPPNGIAGADTLKALGEDDVTPEQDARITATLKTVVELQARLAKLEEKVQWGNVESGGTNRALGAGPYVQYGPTGGLIDKIADAVVAKIKS